MMTGQHVVLFVEAALGAVISLAVVLQGLLLPSSVSAETAHVDIPAETDPAARLQILIKNVHIYDDRDWGEGEIRVTARLYRNRIAEGCARWSNYDDCMIDVARTVLHFNANDGNDVAQSRSIPDDTSRDWVDDPATTSKSIGFPVFADRVYGLSFSAVDEDTFSDDDMGTSWTELSLADDWHTGVHHQRGELPCDAGLFGFCSSAILTEPPGPDSAGNANFSVDYEIRRVPLPDLVGENMWYFPSEGRDFYCMRVGNQGLARAEQSVITFLVDGQVTGTRLLPALEPNARTEACTLPQLTPGEHPMGFTVDQAQQIVEMDERNNTYRSKFTVAAPAQPAPSPTSPSSVQATAVKLKAGTKCKEGKNDVSVTIRNTGSAEVDGLSVGLIVDGQQSQALEQAVNDLKAGAERDIQFRDVELKKGSHTLLGSVSQGSSTDGSKSSDEARLTVNCSSDD